MLTDIASPSQTFAKAILPLIQKPTHPNHEKVHGATYKHICLACLAS
jgi:hypothetical protein